MKIPPRLTQREKEVLPFLAAGETRTGIARKLSISDETVKVHIKNIVDKFDAVSVRDGIADFWEYLEMFSSDGLGYKFFIKSSENHLKLNKDSADGLLKRTLNIVTIEDGQTELQDIFTGSGDIGICYIDGIETKPFSSSMNRQYFKKQFAEPLSENTDVSVTFEVELLNCYPLDAEYHYIRINHPTHEMVLSIDFPLDRPPIEVWAEGRISAAPIKLPKNAFDVKDGVAQLCIYQPKIGEQYMIHWRW